MSMYTKMFTVLKQTVCTCLAEARACVQYVSVLALFLHITVHVLSVS